VSTCPPNFPYVENVDDLPGDAAPGDLCWVVSTKELWIYMGNGEWTHQPQRPPAPPMKIHRAKSAANG